MIHSAPELRHRVSLPTCAVLILIFQASQTIFSWPKTSIDNHRTRGRLAVENSISLLSWGETRVEREESLPPISKTLRQCPRY